MKGALAAALATRLDRSEPTLTRVTGGDINEAYEARWPGGDRLFVKTRAGATGDAYEAEAEGLDKVFIDAGLEWREPGCSACLGMNPDKVPAGERCASTSIRNFVGRQGPGARTHLVSPAMAAAAAVMGKLTDVRELVG